jgi:thiol-disulfide isomerase/thioredoxin
VRSSRHAATGAFAALAAAAAAALALAGCDERKASAAAQGPDPGRVAGVAQPDPGRIAAPSPAPARAGTRTAGVAAAAAVDEKLLAGFCDKYYLAPMPLKGAVAAQGAFGPGPAATPIAGARPGSGGWRWVNFWATWCKPCLEEMPMLGRWRDALVKEGTDFTLELWSVDEDADTVREAVKAGLPAPAWHVQSADKLGDWLEAYGVDREAVLPIQVLVAPSGQIRCLRLGSVRPADYAIVKQLLR